MNSTTILNLKGEFESVLNSLNTLGDQPDSKSQYFKKIKIIKNQIIAIHRSLENENKNHKSIGNSYRMDRIIPNKNDRQSLEENRLYIEKLTEAMLKSSSQLMDFLKKINKPSNLSPEKIEELKLKIQESQFLIQLETENSTQEEARLQVYSENPQIDKDIELKESSKIETKKKKNVNFISLLLLLIASVSALFALFSFQFIIQQRYRSSLLSSESVENEIKSAKALAKKANGMIKSPPYPLTTLRTAQDKMLTAIQILEATPGDVRNSGTIIRYLEIYQTDYYSITRKIAREQRAASNLKMAEKLALEALEMLENPLRTSDTLQTAQNQMQKAINLLESIPKNAFIAPEAQEKLEIYQTNLELITQGANVESLQQ
ncbi:MAG: hypothetical protein AAFO04_01805 [Cyanobacteria bacterium J06592_8]